MICHVISFTELLPWRQGSTIIVIITVVSVWVIRAIISVTIVTITIVTITIVWSVVSITFQWTWKWGKYQLYMHDKWHTIFENITKDNSKVTRGDYDLNGHEGLFVCLLGFNVRAAIFQLYSDNEHEMNDKMNMKWRKKKDGSQG